MYLFVFAFLGNTFYVASILLSEQSRAPPPESLAFLRESLPYVEPFFFLPHAVPFD
jgi:solute carrier family 66 (lysosomal lysine-arginine transporter), member 1